MVCLCLCYFVHPVRVRSGSERRFKSQRRAGLHGRDDDDDDDVTTSSYTIKEAEYGTE